jgi:hypothetical protein
VKDLDSYGHYPIIKKYANKLKSEVLVLDTLVNDTNIDRLVDYLSTSQVGFQLNNIQQDYYD